MAHRVHMPATGLTFMVEPGETVLAAAERAGLSLPHDCRGGGCGTCRIKLLSGKVRYEEFPLALTPEEEGAGYALACQSEPLCDLVIESASAVDEPIPVQRYRASIRTVERLGPEVTHLVLDIPGARAPFYRAGQYMNVAMPDGTMRSFSMASAPGRGIADFHIRRFAGGAFTDQVLSRLKVEDTLDVELPHGAFAFRPEDERPLLMVATGTGLAPLKAILESLMETDCPPVALYWGARTSADLYLHDEIPQWAEQLCEFRYVPVLSRADAAWRGRRGHVQQQVLADIRNLSDYAIYLCGSPAMIADAKRDFLARGASIQHIYAEGFTQQMQPATPVSKAATGGRR